MKLIDPSQRINVLWDNDDGTRYSEEMTIRRLLAVMSDDEIETIDLVRCIECRWFGDFGCAIRIVDESDRPSEEDYCSFGERRADDEVEL